MTYPLTRLRRWLELLVRRAKCATGFHVWIYNTPERWGKRVCRRCRMREEYMLVDFGRSKAWVPRPPNAQREGQTGTEEPK